MAWWFKTQDITWTNVDISLCESVEAYHSEFLNWNKAIFIQEIAIWNVTYKMAANLLRLHCRQNYFFGDDWNRKWQEWVNILKLRQSDCHLADHILKLIFFKDDFFILIHGSHKYISKGPIDNRHHWFRWWLGTEQVTTHYLNQYWHSLVTHICIITWLQWFNP